MNNQKMVKDPMQYRGFTIEQMKKNLFGIKIGKDITGKDTYLHAKSVDEIKVVINGILDRGQERDALAIMARRKK